MFGIIGMFSSRCESQIASVLHKILNSENSNQHRLDLCSILIRRSNYFLSEISEQIAFWNSNEKKNLNEEMKTSIQLTEINWLQIFNVEEK